MEVGGGLVPASTTQKHSRRTRVPELLRGVTRGRKIDETCFPEAS